MKWRYIAMQEWIKIIKKKEQNKNTELCKKTSEKTTTYFAYKRHNDTYMFLRVLIKCVSIEIHYFHVNIHIQLVWGSVK